MKIFKVKSKYVSFDEDESMVIIAETSEKALRLAKSKWTFREGKNINRIVFEVEEINFNEEQIIDISHYGN